MTRDWSVEEIADFEAKRIAHAQLGRALFHRVPHPGLTDPEPDYTHRGDPASDEDAGDALPQG